MDLFETIFFSRICNFKERREYQLVIFKFGADDPETIAWIVVVVEGLYEQEWEVTLQRELEKV